MIQAVAFDLDDTLYPEAQFVSSGYRAVSDEVQRQWGVEIYDDLISRFMDGQRGDLFTPVLRRYLGEVQEVYVQQLVRVYQQHEPRINPFPETLEVLSKLMLSYRLGLISDGSLGVQERKLKALQLRHFFNAVVFSDEWGKDFWKPHARPYKACAYRLGVDTTALVYVGDNPVKDFITARQLGIGTVRVQRNGTLHEKVALAPEFEADHRIGHLGELPILLEKVG